LSDQKQNRHELDSRPSDAVALAVRAGCPIYVKRNVFEQNAIEIEWEEPEEE